jgi:hypothetical protein
MEALRRRLCQDAERLGFCDCLKKSGPPVFTIAALEMRSRLAEVSHNRTYPACEVRKRPDGDIPFILPATGPRLASMKSLTPRKHLNYRFHSFGFCLRAFRCPQPVRNCIEVGLFGVEKNSFASDCAQVPQ